MVDEFNYFLLSPDLNHTIIDWSSQLATKSYFFNSQYFNPQPLLMYQRRETHLLRPPHDTRCVDYRRVGLESQLHCLHECLKHLSMLTLRLVPTDVSIFHLNETTVPLMNEHQKQNVTIRESLSLIRDSCREKCENPNCRDEHFKPFDPSFANPRLSRSTRFASYVIFVPNLPDILIETGAEFSFVDFLMMILNAVSLWTAFCP